MSISSLLVKAAVGLLLVAAPHAGAHELQDNRATLVLRDGTHLSLTLYIAYPEALHQVLAPQRPFMAFLLVYSSMKPEELQRALLRAQARFQSATRVYAAPGSEVALTNWIWPDAKQVQTILQQRVMQAMVDPAGHSHEAPVEVRADALARQEINAVQVQFPEEFQKVLVVAFRPSQLWVEGKALSPAIRF
jgi:hypothetical protein